MSIWDSVDLDSILIEDDHLYKTLNVSSYLSVDDIPTALRINGINYAVIKLTVKDGFLSSLKDNSLNIIH